MMTFVSIKPRFKNSLVFLACIMIAGCILAGNIYAEKQGESSSPKQQELLYYDKESGMKIIKKPSGFLIQMEKNRKGLYIATELGDFPEAYPEDLPPPGAHVDDASEDTDRK